MAVLQSLVFFFSFLLAHSVTAAVEELSYDDLVTRLQSARDKGRNLRDTQERSQILQMGFGTNTSWAQVSEQGQSRSFRQNGFELSLGRELGKPSLVMDGVLRIFPGSQSPSGESHSLQELLGQIQSKKALSQKFAARFSGGFGLRLLNYSNDSIRVSGETSSVLMFATGIEARLSSKVALASDLAYRTPFGSNTADRGGFDLGLRLETKLE